MFEPTLPEVQAVMDYACLAATDWIKDVLKGNEGHVEQTAKTVGCSTFKVTDIKKNLGIVDDPRMALRILKKRGEMPRDLTGLPHEASPEKHIEPGRGLPPRKDDPYFGEIHYKRPGE
jgi:hypothetical protein